MFLFFLDKYIVLECRKAHRIANSSWCLGLRKWDLLQRLMRMRMLLLVPGVGEGFGFRGRLLWSGLGLRELLLRDRPVLPFFNLLALRMGS